MNRRIIALTAILVVAVFAGCKRTETDVTDSVVTETMSGTTETSAMTDTGVVTMTDTTGSSATIVLDPTTTSGTTATVTTGTP